MAAERCVSLRPVRKRRRIKLLLLILVFPGGFGAQEHAHADDGEGADHAQNEQHEDAPRNAADGAEAGAGPSSAAQKAAPAAQRRPVVMASFSPLGTQSASHHPGPSAPRVLKKGGDS